MRGKFVNLNFFSKIRQVPDHQEVLIDMNTEQSIIVEILELANVSNPECLQ